MNQQQAVIQTLEKLGGIATLGQLYEEVFKIKDCEWKTKTPFASVRRIVQLHKEIYKIKPGLYGLISKKSQHEARGIVAETEKNKNSAEVINFGHTYYQALLLIIGKLRGRDCWSPNQDKNKAVLNSTLGELRTLQALPEFSYEHLVKRSATVDVIWFNERKMPDSLFEVEHGTDMQNSLLKLNDLQDFSARMVIVSDAKRRNEFDAKLKFDAFQDIAKRTNFLPYDWLVKEYEHQVESSHAEFTL